VVDELLGDADTPVSVAVDEPLGAADGVVSAGVVDWGVESVGGAGVVVAGSVESVPDGVVESEAGAVAGAVVVVCGVVPPDCAAGCHEDGRRWKWWSSLVPSVWVEDGAEPRALRTSPPLAEDGVPIRIP
jgi:hypothetical protein